MPSSKENEGQELFDWARRCEELFQKLLSTLVCCGGIGTHHRTLRDYSQRFALWAGFIGVFADGGASLDNRLRFYPDVRNLVLKMLKLLQRNLSHDFWFDPANKEGIDEKPPPVIVSETSASLAAVAALDAIRESIDRLRHLAVLIRKSPSSSLTCRIEAFARKADPAKIEEFQMMASLFVTGILPGIDKSLATQLVSSISFRRLRLLYQSKHDEKLKGRRARKISTSSQPEAKSIGREKESILTQEYLPRLDNPQMETTRSPSGPSQNSAVSETENSEVDFEKFRLYDGGLIEASDISTITSIAQVYSYPPRPKSEKGDQYCACNWCSDEIKVSSLERPGWWKNHFKKDLQPYVCISENCSEPPVYFTSFAKWHEHMDNVHTTDWARKIYSPHVWYCDVSPHEYLEFREREELEQHLWNEHSNDLNFKQLERRLERNVLPCPRDKGICPLCNQDILKIYELQESLLSEDETTPLSQKPPPFRDSRVRSQDVEDFSSSDEETSEDTVDDASSLNTEERKRLDFRKVSKHIARHLKSLAFLSIRYLGHDAVNGEDDSGKAASGAGDSDIEVSNHADKAIKRILDDFPEAADGKLEFEDNQTERDKEELQIWKDMAEQRLSDEEGKCRDMFCLAADNKYKLYKDQVETRAEGTCQWFLGHENFKKWLQQDSGLLLVMADPGFGKSVLAKHLIDEALPRSATICYFFFNGYEQNTPRQAICVLLHQIFLYKPFLVRHAMSNYAKHGKLLARSTQLLWDIFTNVAQDPKIGSLIIVLDALDECAEWIFHDLLILNNKSHQRGYGKILLTSRPRPVNPGGNFLEIRVSGEQEFRNEVDHLIEHRVEQLATERQLSEPSKEYLAKWLLDIPNPTHFLVYLVFECLKTVNLEGVPEEVQSSIAQLPRSINEAYEHILSQSRDSLTVRRGLSIILAANTPLTLSEMNVAMNVDEQCNSIDDIKAETGEDFKSDLNALFGLFISFRCGKIEFIHDTARDFLLNKSPLPATIPSKIHWQHSITAEYAHSVLTSCCVMYLNLFNSEASPLPNVYRKTSDFIDSHAFLKYSAKNWGTHLHEAKIGSNDTNIIPLALKICDPGSRAYPVWSRIFEEYHVDTPLLRAVENGHRTVVQLLLDQGADPELRSHVSWRTPLSPAAENGHVAIVQVLLDRGADLESEDSSGQTPLSRAATKGRVTVVQLLLDRGADLESEDNNGLTPLSWTAENGHIAVAQLLLERGANLETKDDNGLTPLSRAARNGHSAVVQLLLDRGADLESEDNNGLTPLSWTAENGYIAVAQLLLERGANLETKDDNGLTPLSRAARNGHFAVVQLLLDQEADLESKDNNGLTPLSLAAIRGHVAIVQLLLDRGANINSKDKWGYTPLLRAKACRQEDVVRLLRSRDVVRLLRSRR
ncbi:hypothetical protein FHL15_004929 [Xylaria flabelliformis]|uniref:Nephrocystin 3-like N-terminal domain-containing protein n=1 Tax=Xylaria flabelliformis TaxID=2512241 RepID=A0A553I1U5_9PEZI|nr:hypothetical protein FHL15_004929 [Xylaria flabelliformis]